MHKSHTAIKSQSPRGTGVATCLSHMGWNRMASPGVQNTPSMPSSSRTGHGRFCITPNSRGLSSAEQLDILGVHRGGPDPDQASGDKELWQGTARESTIRPKAGQRRLMESVDRGGSPWGGVTGKSVLCRQRQSLANFRSTWPLLGGGSDQYGRWQRLLHPVPWHSGPAGTSALCLHPEGTFPTVSRRSLGPPAG